MEMTLTLADIFLLLSSSASLFLWQREAYKFELYKRALANTLRLVLRGEANILDRGKFIQIEVVKNEELKNDPKN